jgi:hypothetical protein
LNLEFPAPEDIFAEGGGGANGTSSQILRGVEEQGNPHEAGRGGNRRQVFRRRAPLDDGQKRVWARRQPAAEPENWRAGEKKEGEKTNTEK